MKRPALVALLFLSLGILGEYFILSIFVAVFYFIVNGLLMILCCEKFKKRSLIPVFALFFAIGFYSMSLRGGPGNLEAEDIMLLGEEAVIKGMITQSTMTENGKWRIVLKSDSIRNSESDTKKSAVMLIYLDYENELVPGTEIVVSGKILSPEPLRNPGGFNEYLYFKTRKLDYRVYGRLLHHGNLSVNMNTLFYYTRYKIGSVYDALLPKREAGIAKSLILGDRGNLDSYVKDLYQEAGIYHIVAISGLHISVIAEVLKHLFSKLAGYRKGLFISCILIAIYCLFTGASVSTVRAVSMAYVSAGAFFLKKDYDMLSSAAFTAIVLLLYEPFYLFEAGFQLSFSCVFGIGALSGPMKYWLGRQRIYKGKFRFPAESVAMSAAVSIASFPVLIMHYHRIAVYSVIVNLFVIPLCSFAVILGFITGLLGLLSIEAAINFAAPFYIILKYFEGVCLFFTSLPFSALIIGYQPILMMLGYYFLVFKFVWGNWSRQRKIASISIFIGVFALWNAMPAPFSVTMLDVGQGDCFVIEKGREVYVIDGGGWYGRGIENNTGAKVLAPYLEYRGITKVTAAFITHLDSDHYTGIYELMALKDVKKIILPETADKKSIDYQLIFNMAQMNHTEIEFFSEGRIFEGKSQIKFETLYPFMYNSSKDINESSLILMLRYESFKMLFMADAGFETENDIMDSAWDINAHILKAGHHGSKYATGSSFAQNVNPAAVFISAGQNNVYGHPHSDTLQRIEELGADIYVTADDGAVILKYKSGHMNIRTMIRRKMAG